MRRSPIASFPYERSWPPLKARRCGPSGATRPRRCLVCSRPDRDGIKGEFTRRSPGRMALPTALRFNARPRPPAQSSAVRTGKFSVLGRDCRRELCASALDAFLLLLTPAHDISSRGISCQGKERGEERSNRSTQNQDSAQLTENKRESIFLTATGADFPFTFPPPLPATARGRAKQTTRREAG
jgi:hypothetical protein